MPPVPPAPPLPPPLPPPAPPLPPQRAAPARAGGAGGAGITPQALQAAKARLRVTQGFYPPVAFHFAVSFGSNPKDSDGAFREVSGIGPEIETETVNEGGLNGYAHVLPKSIKHPRLVLKRGVAAKESRLVKWCQQVLDGGFVKPIDPLLVHVFLLDAAGDPLRCWTVENAWPVKWEIEGFQSTRNEVAMEKIELAYARSNRMY
jgi:phage tail-like protein